MIRLGLRLTLAGGREAGVRLVVIGVAVGLGVGLLLITLAGVNATNAQNARYAWLNTASGSGNTAASVTASASDPLWWKLAGDDFHRRLIGRVDVAATGSRSPVPRGIPQLPGPGQFYASPALAALLRSTPAGELGDRFPGHQIGTIGPVALPAPNSLVIVIGHTVEQLSHVPGARKATRIATTTPSSCDNCQVGTNAQGIDLILSVVAGALIFPLLIFIGTATRLAAARREQRFAAMRLVGATSRQISVISAVESSVAAVAGTAAGFGVFFLLRSPMAAIPFTGVPFFPSDLSLRPADILLVVIGVPVAAVAAARLALRRVSISPLGVTRRVTPRAPRAYRLIPLALGIGELAYFVGRRPPTTAGQVQAYLPGGLLIMAGLVIAGPWLTMVGARTMARRTSRPTTLIAGRRLSDNPKAGFRAISGLVLALFVTSACVGVITTIDDYRGIPSGISQSADARGALSDMFWPGENGSSHPAASVAPTPDPVPAGLLTILGVQTVTVTYANPLAFGSSAGSQLLPLPGLISCAQLSRTPAFGRCAAGAEVASVYPDFSSWSKTPPAATVWPTAAVSLERLQHLPVLSIVVAAPGSTSAIERARTALEIAYPFQNYPPITESEVYIRSTQALIGWQQLTNVVIVVSLCIAGCSLAVSVAGSLSDRKRPFSLLRLTGVPLGMLRRIVVLEAAVPLLIAAVVAAGTGFLAAKLYLTSEMGYTLRAPGAEYYLIVLAGLAASLGIIASTLPLLKRNTGPETARNE
jgi:hypothetical protein